MKNQKKSDLEILIKKAVNAGLAAGRTQAEQEKADAYRATERRLYALPTLIKKAENDKQRLAELEETGAPARSKDIARFTRTGVRLTPSEILEALIADLKASIAADEHEIETILTALKNVEGDPYYLVVKGRYFEGVSDEEIAGDIPCDTSTVRRHRGRLVRVVAVWLYGVKAV